MENKYDQIHQTIIEKGLLKRKKMETLRDSNFVSSPEGEMARCPLERAARAAGPAAPRARPSSLAACPPGALARQPTIGPPIRLGLVHLLRPLGLNLA